MLKKIIYVSCSLLMSLTCYLVGVSEGSITHNNLNKVANAVVEDNNCLLFSDSTLSTLPSVSEQEMPVAENHIMPKIESGMIGENILKKLTPEQLRDKALSDETQRERSLRALAELNNPESKVLLIAIAQDSAESEALRKDIIRKMDWQGSVEKAIELLSSEDESVRESIIFSAQDSSFNEDEREQFENYLDKVFNEGGSAFIQISAINYFANKHPEKLYQIKINSSDIDTFNLVSQHLQEVTSGI